MVYVLNIQGNPLMPCKEAKARKLLKNSLAKIIKRTPFTIQLLFECENKTQDITLGIDTGSKTIGVSASTEKQELYSAEVVLRDDIVDLISTKRQNRRTRRNRLRYRKPRFNNRIKFKKNGWLAPSILQKIETHLNVIKKIHKILPISKIIVETASFDIQKIKNPNITGVEYQQGEQLEFWNVREYVLHRDGHTCQHCKGKSKDKILNVHHIESRKTGGDSHSNLITLCETCHKKYHNGEIKLKVKRGQSFRDSAFMGIMRWAFYEKLKETYQNVKMTFGYITKNTRISNNLPKEHCIDAYCIAGNLKAKLMDSYFYQIKKRCQNRQIHKANFLKGGRKKLNQAPYIVKGFRLFDKVSYQGNPYYIFGRRSSGAFDVRNLSGNKVNKGSINCKYLRLLETRKYYLTEKRERAIPPND